MMMNQGGAGSMSDALSNGEMPQGGLSPAYVNPASMSPMAMANMQGSPLANAGANMGNYMAINEHMMPEENKAQGPGFAAGGLAHFADGGMPPPQQAPMGAPPGAPIGPPPGADPAAGGGLPGQQGTQEQGNPELVQEIEQIFQQNMDNPKAIADQLLELIKREIQKVVSPEEMAHLQTPEGEQQMQEIVKQIMSQMGAGEGGGGLAQAGGAPPAPSGPPPGGAPAPAPGGMG